MTKDDGTLAMEKEIRSQANRPSETGRKNPRFVAWEFAREDFGDGATVRAEATHCGATESREATLTDWVLASGVPPEILDVQLYGTSSSNIRVRYTGKWQGSRVGLLLEGVETDWTYSPQFASVDAELTFWSTAPGAAQGQQLQLTQRFCTPTSGDPVPTPSPPSPLPASIPAPPPPNPHCGSLGVVLPDGPVLAGAEEIRLSRAPPLGVTLHVFDAQGTKIGQTTTEVVSLNPALQAGDTLRFLLVGESGCESDRVVVVEVAPSSCSVPTLPALPTLSTTEFTVSETAEFIIQDQSGDSPSRVEMPAFEDSNYSGSYEIDDPVVGRAALPLLNGSVPPGTPVVVFVHGICPDLKYPFSSKDGYRVLQRQLALDGIASFSLALRVCSQFGYGPWRALLLESFLGFLVRMPQSPGEPPLPDNPFGGELQGKLDLGQILLVGHSTGFEGIAQYLVRKSRSGMHPSITVRSAIGLGGWFFEPHVVVSDQDLTEIPEWDIDRRDVLEALDGLPLLMLLGSEEDYYLYASERGPPDSNQGSRGAALRWLLHRDRPEPLSYLQLPDGDHDEWSSTWSVDPSAGRTHQLGAAPLIRRWARIHLLGEPQHFAAFDGQRRILETGPYLAYLPFFSPGQTGLSDLFHRPPVGSGNTDSGGPISPPPGQMAAGWSTLEYQDFSSPPDWEVDSQPLVGVSDAQLATIRLGLGAWMLPSPSRRLQIDATSSGQGVRTQAMLHLGSGDYFAVPGFEDSHLHPTSTTIGGQCLVDSGATWASGWFELSLPLEVEVIKLDRVTSWP